MHKTRAAGLTGLFCLAALCGCGQKGPLVLPDAPAKHRNIPRLPKQPGVATPGVSTPGVSTPGDAPTPATPATPGTPGAAAPAPATAPTPR